MFVCKCINFLIQSSLECYDLIKKTDLDKILKHELRELGKNGEVK